MKKILSLLCIFLIGCAHNKPVTKIVIQEVKIPIYMPCKALIPPGPLFNFPNLSVEQDIYEKNKILLADRKLHLAYEIELLASLNSCVN